MCVVASGFVQILHNEIPGLSRTFQVLFWGVFKDYNQSVCGSMEVEVCVCSNIEVEVCVCGSMEVEVCVCGSMGVGVCVCVVVWR